MKKLINILAILATGSTFSFGNHNVSCPSGDGFIQKTKTHIYGPEPQPSPFVLPHDPPALDSYNVTWNSPGVCSGGSMPVGNGDIGLNVWVEEDGDLLFFIGKTDAWSSQGGRDEILLKLGRIRVQLEPNPFKAGLPFRKELQLRQGRIHIVAGEQGNETGVSVWVDANHPVIHVESMSDRPIEMNVSLEMWREDFDRVLDTPNDRIAWHHRDEPGDFVDRYLRGQNLEGAGKLFEDPYKNRTFGGVIVGEGLRVSTGNPRMLSSTRPSVRNNLQISVLTDQSPSSQAWLEKVEKQMKAYIVIPRENVRADHLRWWNDFWDRSWIRIAPNKQIRQPKHHAFDRNTITRLVDTEDLAEQTHRVPQA